MGILYITEFADEGKDQSGNLAPVAMMPPIAQQAITFTTSTQSAVLNAQTRLVRLHTDSICSVRFAVNPTAVTTDARLAANMTEYFAVPPGSGLKIAAVTNT